VQADLPSVTQPHRVVKPCTCLGQSSSLGSSMPLSPRDRPSPMGFLENWCYSLVRGMKHGEDHGKNPVPKMYTPCRCSGVQILIAKCSKPPRIIWSDDRLGGSTMDWMVSVSVFFTFLIFNYYCILIVQINEFNVTFSCLHFIYFDHTHPLTLPYYPSPLPLP
jgi:hypothetical protein